MKTGWAVALATTVVMAVAPHIAHAACSGTACASFSFDGKRFTNRHKTYTMQLKGCFIEQSGTCGSPPTNFDFFLGPEQSRSFSMPALGATLKADVQGAIFVDADRNPLALPTPPSHNANPVAPKGNDKPNNKPIEKTVDRPIDQAINKAIRVTNDGKVPLRVVILDTAKSAELGRSPGHMTGSFVIDLSRRVGKYHWEAFAQGDTEPCQKQRDETRPAITIHCEPTKASDKP